MVGIGRASWEQSVEAYEPPLMEVFGTVEDLTHHGCTHGGEDAMTCRTTGFQGSVITPGAG